MLKDLDFRKDDYVFCKENRAYGRVVNVYDDYISVNFCGINHYIDYKKDGTFKDEKYLTVNENKIQSLFHDPKQEIGKAIDKLIESTSKQPIRKAVRYINIYETKGHGGNKIKRWNYHKTKEDAEKSVKENVFGLVKYFKVGEKVQIEENLLEEGK